MKSLERRLALIEAEAERRRSQRNACLQIPPDVDWLGNPIGSEPTEPIECPPGSGVDWLGFPINYVQRKL
jgi:hypothetical protein